MISAAEPPKRMVSSVFITLTSPYRATVTPSSHIHSSKGRDGLSSGLPLSPGYGTSEPQLAKRRPSAASQDGNSCSTVPSLASPLASQPSSVPTSPNTTADKTRRSCSGGSTKQAVMAQITPSELSPPPLPETAFPEVLPPPPPETAFPELSPDPSSPQPSRGLSSIPSLSGGPLRSQASSPAVEAGAPVGTQLVDRHPSGGSLGNEQLQTRLANPGSDLGPESKELCGFCRKTVALSEPAIDALNRTYHSSCFQCRQCNVPLAGKLYYNKAGIPLCEDCYQASLEPCWACGEVIKDHVIRALERAYHPPCFVCTTCRQPIGEQRFAQGEVGEVYCLQDYYRKYAPECSACKQLIIPREDGTDSYTVECLGQSFHEDCYRCEVCRTVLSPEPNDQGCHPLDNRILCKPCHLSLVQRAQ